MTAIRAASKIPFMDSFLDAMTQFLGLYIPLAAGLIWVTIELDIFPMEDPQKQARVLKIFVAVVVGGTLGLISRFLSLPPIASHSTYLLTLAAGPILTSALLAQLAKHLLRKRNQVRYGNFWIFFSLTSSYLIVRVPLSLFSL